MDVQRPTRKQCSRHSWWLCTPPVAFALILAVKGTISGIPAPLLIPAPNSQAWHGDIKCRSNCSSRSFDSFTIFVPYTDLASNGPQHITGFHHPQGVQPTARAAAKKLIAYSRLLKPRGLGIHTFCDFKHFLGYTKFAGHGANLPSNSALMASAWNR